MVEPHHEPHTDGPGDHRWLNPATMKGAILIAVGVAILASPDRSMTLLRWVLGVALIANMAVEFYTAGRQREDRRSIVVMGLVSGLIGIGFLLFPETSLRVMAYGLALLVALYGVRTGTRAYQKRREGSDWVWGVERAIVAVALALVLVLLPQAVLLSLLLAVAMGSILYGALAVATGLRGEREDVDRLDLTDMIRRWMDERDVGDKRRRAIADNLYFEPPETVNKRVSYWVMLGLSVVIGTLAVLQDSTAVIIGAMLIAPLMTPIMAMAAGVVGGWRDRVASSLIVLVLSVAFAIGLAWIVAEWIPALVPLGVNGQVQDRIQPTALDLLIALAAGAAGAYATVDRRMSGSIAGVAIAVALMPPLAVVGVTLQAQQYDWTKGALLLFTTNFVAIFLAGVAVFYFTGLAPLRKFNAERRNTRGVLAMVVTVGLIILIPLTFSAQGILGASNQDSTALDVATEWATGTDLEVASAAVGDLTVTIEIEGTGILPDVSDLQQQLSDALSKEVKIRIEYDPIKVITYSVDGGENIELQDVVTQQ